MPLTVREALEMEPLKTARVLAGDDALDRPISSVSVIEVPDVWRWLHGNEMLLTTFYPMRDSVDAQLEMVRQLAAKDISCLVVKTGRFIDKIAPEIVALSKEKHLPLVELPGDVSFLDVIHDVLGRVMGQNIDVVLESERLGHTVLRMVGDGQDLQTVATFMARSLNNPVSIHDAEGKLVTLTSYRSTEKVLKSLEKLDLKTLVSLAETSRTLMEEAVKGGYLSSDAESKDCFTPRLVVPAETNGQRFGYLVFWENRPMSGVALKAADSFALAAALSMAKEKAAQAVERKYATQFMQQLISGSIAEEAAKQQGPSLGIKVGDASLVISVSPGAANLQTESMIRDSVIQYNPGAGVCAQGDDLVVIWPVSGSKGDSGCDRPGACLDAKGIREALQPWYNYLSSRSVRQTRVCVGRPAARISEIPEAYKTSQECVRLLDSLSSHGTALLLFNELGIMRLLALCPKGELSAFRKEVLAPVLQYDATNGRGLEETLFEYLERNGNLVEAAKRLYIHTNTLKYRIGKIAKLLGADLDDMSTRVTLWTALTIGRLARDDSR